MEFDAQEIKDVVDETTKKRLEWARVATECESVWSLSRTESERDKRELDGVRTIVLPDPYNTVLLAQRFVADEMRVEIPSLTAKQDDDDRGELLEEWLVAYDFESNRLAGTNHTLDKVWQGCVLGRGASITSWIGDILKEQKIEGHLPIYRRNLDPRNVGVTRGAYYTEHAYHTYKTTQSDIEQRYPDYKFPERDANTIRQGYFNEKYKVIDFYYRHKGAIWHCVTVDDKFAVKPVQTDLPDIPIIEWYGDGAPIMGDEAARSIPLLYPMLEAYKAKNDFAGVMMTGIELHFNPIVIARNLSADKSVKVGPGATIYLDNEENIEAFRAEPNVPMVQNMLAILQSAIDQSTFPGVAYGESGGVQAGYAISSLQQQSISRVNVMRSNIEAAQEAEFQLALGIVDRIAGDEGVEIYGRSSKRDRGGPLTIRAKDVKGNYANRVFLIPERPLDDNGKLMTLMNMHEKGIISASYIQNRGANLPLPRNESTRIALEQTLKSPEMMPKVSLRALQATYKTEEWMRLISGTPLQQVHEQEVAWQEQEDAKKEAAKEARRAEKEQKELAELMASMQGMMPPGMPPDGMGASGLPPMGGSMPPMPPGMGMPPPTGAPSPMGQSPLPSDMSMQPQGMPGIPPQMAGQLTPQMLGLGPDSPPGTFQEMTGQAPPSDEELMRSMGALPPPM